jgi:hypothetical protein
MFNSIGIIFSDDLITSELVKTLTEANSSIEIKILADSENLHRINNNFLSSCSCASIKEIMETDCLVILTDVNNIIGKIKKYKGKIIDFTGYLKDVCDNVYEVHDPINYIINLLFQDINNISGNVYLPLAIFGKAGIEELLNQVKNVYNFINNREKYLGVNLPFNVIFLDRCSNSVIRNYVNYMREKIPSSFSLRLLPVMTGFIIDFFYNDNNEPDITNIELLSDHYELVNITNEKKIIGIYNNTGCALTIVADYIDIIVRQIIDILENEVLAK